MRIMGFSIDWPKLKQDRFTTFRFERRDKDWAQNEAVQIKLKPRSKGGGEYRGIAVIEKKESRVIEDISKAEAIEDGFESWETMWEWFKKAHTPSQFFRPLNKLTLKWLLK